MSRPPRNRTASLASLELAADALADMGEATAEQLARYCGWTRRWTSLVLVELERGGNARCSVATSQRRGDYRRAPPPIWSLT